MYYITQTLSLRIMDGLNVHYITPFYIMENCSLVWMYKDNMDGLSVTNYFPVVATSSNTTIEVVVVQLLLLLRLRPSLHQRQGAMRKEISANGMRRRPFQVILHPKISAQGTKQRKNGMDNTFVLGGSTKTIFSRPPDFL